MRRFLETQRWCRRRNYSTTITTQHEEGQVFEANEEKVEIKKDTTQHAVDEMWEILNKLKPYVFKKALDYGLDAIEESTICGEAFSCFNTNDNRSFECAQQHNVNVILFLSNKYW